MSFKTRKTLVAGLVLMLLSTSAMIVVLRKNEDQAASKREQELQIDVAFIIHGSKNITSPQRKKTFEGALDWAKKITQAFGEIGINKTRVGLILYAEKAKLMFNFTEKPNKNAAMEGLDKASSPPALGNKTFTGRALKLTLKTLVKETRKEALKKFFVFTDRPPDDDPTSPAEAIKEKQVEMYGLDGNTTPSTWFIHDYSLDSLYTMLKDGPFKGNKENMQDKSTEDANANLSIPTQKPLLLGAIHFNSFKTSKQKITANQYSRRPSITGKIYQHLSQNNLPNPVNANYTTSNPVTSQTLVSNKDGLSNPGNMKLNPKNLAFNPGNTVLNSENSVLSPGNLLSNPGNYNPGIAVYSGKEDIHPSKTFNSTYFKPAHKISGLISKENKEKEENFTKIVYGKDASVVITENNMKSRNLVGRYSSTIDVNPSPTEFGTVIGGVRVNGQSTFDVIKPTNNSSDSENSNLRSKLGNTVGAIKSWRNGKHKKLMKFRFRTKD